MRSNQVGVWGACLAAVHVVGWEIRLLDPPNPLFHPAHIYTNYVGSARLDPPIYSNESIYYGVIPMADFRPLVSASEGDPTAFLGRPNTLIQARDFGRDFVQRLGRDARLSLLLWLFEYALSHTFLCRHSTVGSSSPSAAAGARPAKAPRPSSGPSPTDHPHPPRGGRRNGPRPRRGRPTGSSWSGCC